MQSFSPQVAPCARIVFALAALTLTPSARADEPPGPTARFSVGGEASLSVAARDLGFFNNTVYDRSVLRLFRLSLQASLRAGDHLALLTELRSDNLDSPKAYALYARLRPWRERAFDLQAGRIPPVFGAFARRRYGLDNPLVGYPLAYQYLTSLRPDAVPRTADDLLRNRGSGWLVRYGDGYAASSRPGLPLVNSFVWDTGVEARVGSRPWELSAALTQGTLSNPLFRDDNDGKQLAAHLTWTPTMGLVAGASAARGAYLGQVTLDSLPAEAGSRNYFQRAYGLDLEYSRGYWLLRSEAVLSEWDLPGIGEPRVPSLLRALGLMVEGRYRLAPGLSLAARLDHLGFGEIQGSGGRASWDAPITRVEAAASYSPWRNATVKVSYQHNWRDGGRVRAQGFLIAQVLCWF